MIFTHTLEKVLTGAKTHTCRPIQPGDNSWADPNNIGVIVCVTGGESGRVKWRVGRDYAVQPGRGQTSVGRIRLLGIARLDVRNVTQEIVQAEGFSHWERFFDIWCLMHDPEVLTRIPIDATAAVYQMHLRKRPDDRYAAWGLRFKLIDPPPHQRVLARMSVPLNIESEE